MSKVWWAFVLAIFAGLGTAMGAGAGNQMVEKLKTKPKKKVKCTKCQGTGEVDEGDG